jgi:hypothetical protein
MGALTWAAEWYYPEGDMTLYDNADELMRVLMQGIANHVPPHAKRGRSPHTATEGATTSS